MFHEVADAGELPPAELRERYDELLRSTVEEYGTEHVVEASGVSRETVAAIEAGESPELTLEEGGAILAVAESEPDADAIVLEARDHLRMGMTTAVLDVDAGLDGLDGALDAREIQQKIEGRLRMTLDDFAQLHGYIDGQRP
jgi:hypothetical protein